MAGPPLAVGEVSTDTEHSGDLGKKYTIDGVLYVLGQFGSAITSAAGRTLVTSYSSSGATFVFDLAASAGDPGAGVVPGALTGIGLSSGDPVASSYMLFAIKGNVTGTLLSTTGTGNLSTNTSGTLTVATAETFTTADFGSLIGRVSAAATGAGTAGVAEIDVPGL